MRAKMVFKFSQARPDKHLPYIRVDNRSVKENLKANYMFVGLYWEDKIDNKQSGACGRVALSSIIHYECDLSNP